MLLSVQSPEGTKRIDCESKDSTHAFMTKIQKAFQLDSLTQFDIYTKRNKQGRIVTAERKRLSHYDLKHGDTVFLVYNSSTTSQPTLSSSNSSFDETTERNSTIDHVSPEIIVEDEVDTYLFKHNGCIHRERDAKLCQHGLHGKCIHCIPVEPYNEDYLQEQNIKHMSFHSYLRKLTGGADKGKFAALENVSCKIKSGCKEHLPWPQGICTKCQPNALTLNRQLYRHVDNVVFENPFLVERFLNYWRCTGHQRIGYLYGHYEHHKDVPLGIKATVAAIYEPPQEGSESLLRLLPDTSEKVVERIAKQLGLVKLGWIFTDLIAEDLQKGTVKHLRNISSHFLSAQECIMAGDFQNRYPNPCKLSPDGSFGSKFVTICFTGDKTNQVHMEGYQVSNQCMALVRDNCLLPTIDAPELAYVRESSNEQYVPDVFYKVKDSYGNEVTRIARPLPIEYLLVDVPVSTPNEPQFTFFAEITIKPFPVENRFIDGQLQDIGHLATYLRRFKPDQFLEAMSDFHVLIYLATMEVLPLMDALEPLLKAVRTKDKDLAREWSKSEQWATVEHILDAEGSWMPETHTPSSVASVTATAMWTCKHCTFLNQPLTITCEMCSLPQ